MLRAPAIRIAIMVLWTMTSISASSDDRLRDLEWMSTASVAEINAEISAGADPVKPHSEGNPGHTPLHFAAQANPDPSVTALFIETGADLEARSTSLDGATPLHLAAGGWGMRGVELSAWTRNSIGRLGAEKFFEMRNKMEESGKMVGNNADVVGRLLDEGADIEARDDRGATPLHRAAAASRSPEVIELLLGRSADTEARDDRGLTPLMAAAIGNRVPNITRALLSHGADSNVRSAAGATVLHLAAHNLNPEVLSILLSLPHSNVNAQDERGRTPLHAAANNEFTGFTKLLLDHGADPESTDHSGTTPLHVSLAQNDNPAVSVLLIEHGADTRARDTEGNLPKEIMESKSEPLRRWSEESYERLKMLLQ